MYFNKIVVITGSSGQLGRFLVKLFLSLGCVVYGLDKKKTDIKSKNFKFKKIDLSKFEQIKEVINSIYSIHKKLDIFINNAAISYKSHFSQRKKNELDTTCEINLSSVIYIMKLISLKHNKKKICRIINVGSIYGVKSPDFSLYSNNKNINSEIYGATKAGIIQITKYFAVALAKQNILVNCISPGGIRNKKMQNSNFLKKYKKKVPLKRMAVVEDFETAFLYLSNPKTKYTTGQNIIIDGGLTLC